jgi:hypothetical protein
LIVSGNNTMGFKKSNGKKGYFSNFHDGSRIPPELLNKLMV